ncbi:hypothetical protein KI387_004982, partial [Taxus chinensis]
SNFAAAWKDNIVFYAHEITGGSNPTTVTVAGVNGTSSVMSAFGTVNIITHAVTEGPKASSMAVGKFQGLEAGTNFAGTNYHLIFSVVYEKEKYNGSTLEIHGTIRSLESHWELAVAGGTGRFRYARGYVVAEIVAAAVGKVDYKFNATIRSY